MSFINDRHAEDHIARYVELTKNLTVESIEISTAMRLPFFADCLASNRYKRYSGMRLRAANLLAGFEFEQTDENADCIYIQEGTSERERQQLVPFRKWFRDHNIPMATFKRKSFGNRVSAILNSISFRGLSSSDRANILDIAQALQNEFNLSDEFSDWFLYQIRRFIIRYESALQIFEKTKPKSLIVIGEYTMNSRPVVLAAQKVGGIVSMTQHGFLGQSWLYDPVKSDYIFLWGDVDKEWFINRGFDEERLILTGCMRGFRIENDYRRQMREKYGITGTVPTAIFFAPNLEHEYHERAHEFLTNAYKQVNWIIRPHPVAGDARVNELYPEMDLLSSSVSLKEALALADLAVHDYSSMQFGVYAGIETACLTLDGPYPDYYSSLLGEQHLIESQEQLVSILTGIKPGYHLEPEYTVTMANHGDYSVNEVCSSLVENTK